MLEEIYVGICCCVDQEKLIEGNVYSVFLDMYKLIVILKENAFIYKLINIIFKYKPYSKVIFISKEQTPHSFAKL